MRMHAWISGREQEDDIQKTLKHLSASLPCVFHYIILLPFTWYYLANPFSTMTMTVCHVAYITRQKWWLITPSLCPAMQPYFQLFTYCVTHIIHTYSSRFMHLYLHIYQTSSDSISGSKHAHQKHPKTHFFAWERMGKEDWLLIRSKIHSKGEQGSLKIAEGCIQNVQPAYQYESNSLEKTVSQKHSLAAEATCRGHSHVGTAITSNKWHLSHS